VKMLESDSELTRIYGWDALRLVFDEESKVIQDYSPYGSTEECRRQTALLRQALAEKFAAGDNRGSAATGRNA